MSSEVIYHLAESQDWETRTDHYRPSTLESEGFVHCSTSSQIDDVVARHFPGRTDLIKLSIDPNLLGESLVYEDLYDLGEEYPHVYGVIPLDAIVTADVYGDGADH